MLSAGARSAIARAGTIYVSPLSCWEVGRLAARGRLTLAEEPQSWVQTLFAHDRVELAPLSASAATAAASLGDDFPGDPIDRLLYATAADFRLPFVTRDRAIRAYATKHKDLRVIW